MKSAGANNNVSGGSVTAGTQNQIAIAIATTMCQPDVLDELRKAIDGVTGHNGSIIATKSGDQTLILTQNTAGVDGNKAIVSAAGLSPTYTIPTSFTGGTSSPVVANNHVLTIGSRVYSKNLTAQNIKNAVNKHQGSSITSAMANIDKVSLTQQIVEFGNQDLGNTTIGQTGTHLSLIHI